MRLWGLVYAKDRNGKSVVALYEEPSKRTLGDHLLWDTYFNQEFDRSCFDVSLKKRKICLHFENKEFHSRGHIYRCHSCGSDKDCNRFRISVKGFCASQLHECWCDCVCCDIAVVVIWVLVFVFRNWFRNSCPVWDCNRHKERLR